MVGLYYPPGELAADKTTATIFYHVVFSSYPRMTSQKVFLNGPSRLYKLNSLVRREICDYHVTLSGL